MKTYCRNIRIATPAFVRAAIDRFLKGKRSRRDVQQFLERNPDLDELARQIAAEIRNGDFRHTTIRHFNRTEPITGKHRIIGRQTIRHQIYDYVAVGGLQTLLDAKIGRWQTASIPGRGTIDARRAIKRWTRERDSRCFVKLDVRKYYPSIDRTTLKAMLAHDVRNPTLLRLVNHLIDQYQGDNGLNIGSYLSQWLANYYLSPAYHHACQNLTATRTRRRTGITMRRRLITHVVFYMDDILLIGKSKRDLKIAARKLASYLKTSLKLDVHPEWNVKWLDKEPIDMVGYTFRPRGRVNIRAGVFVRARRTFRHMKRNPTSILLARRCASYYGYFKHSDSIQYRRRAHIDDIMRTARKTLSNHTRKERPCCRKSQAPTHSPKSTTIHAATASPTSASAPTSPHDAPPRTTDRPTSSNTSPRKPTSSAPSPNRRPSNRPTTS